MRILWLVPVFALLLGCSAQVVPRQAPGGVISGGAQPLSQDGIAITAQLDQIAYAPYRQVDNITSFQLQVTNQRSTAWTFPFDRLILVTADGRQFSAVSPAQVKELVSRDLPYLVPYPYVGYYYLEDAQKSSYFNSFTSNLPYYAANRPQDIFTQALPESAVQPGNHISGLAYFIVDLTSMTSFSLKLDVPAAAGYPAASFVFPFAVEK